MPSVGRIIHGPLTPHEARTTRLPVALLALIGLVAGVGFGVQKADEAAADYINDLTTDYGCATAVVHPGGTAVQAALEAGRQVANVDGEPNLQSVITQTTTHLPGSAHVQPGTIIKVCVENNPVEGFGDSGWIAEVTIPPAE